MEIKDMTIDELNARKVELRKMIDAEDADLDAIEAEGRAINAEIEERKAIEAEKAEIREAIAEGDGEVIEKFETEERKEMTLEELRNSSEYIDAYANYIKTGDDTECRNKVTTINDTTPNGTGTVPVPTFVYDIVKTAWEKDGIMSRVRKAYMKGNLKVGFEISGTAAAIHAEGAAAISEEDLVLGIVDMTPQSIKKVVQISDEVLDLGSREFLNYIYDEIAYRIAKKAADTLITKITACTASATTGCPAAAAVTAASIAITTIATALGTLSDEAQNPVVMMNKATWSAFKAVQYANTAGVVDPFEGLPVVFNNTIKAYTAASTGDVYAIVGDLGHGALANYPNGEEITFKFDDMTLKKADLVEVLGRQYVALGVVANNAFANIKK